MLVIWLGALLIVGGVLFMMAQPSGEGSSALQDDLVRGCRLPLSSLGGLAAALGSERIGRALCLSRLVRFSYWPDLLSGERGTSPSCTDFAVSSVR